MPRIRTIKPDFFKHDELAELPALTRLLFIGLWTQADRDGRLYDRPKRLKIEICPYDDYDVETGLQQLEASGFILRYQTGEGEAAAIQIMGFTKHQQPNVKEVPSTIPAPCMHRTGITGKEGKGKEEEIEQEKEFGKESLSKGKEQESQNGFAGESDFKEKNFLDDDDDLILPLADDVPHVGTPPAGAQTPGAQTIPPTSQTEVSLVLPWDTPAFITAWQGWKEYRAAIERPVKLKNEQAALVDLNHISTGLEETALKIIAKSIANNWHCLYPLNKLSAHEQPNPNHNQQHNKSRSAAQRLAARMADRLQRPAG